MPCFTKRLPLKSDTQNLRLGPLESSKGQTKTKIVNKGKIIITKHILSRSRELGFDCPLMLTGRATSDRNLLFTAKPDRGNNKVKTESKQFKWVIKIGKSKIRTGGNRITKDLFPKNDINSWQLDRSQEHDTIDLSQIF